MVFRTQRVIRARNVVCLRSIFWVGCFPTVCFLVELGRSIHTDSDLVSEEPRSIKLL
jgi:hypothetical protein